MKYQALYRKYRPKAFSDVAGQKHIIRTVKNAIALDKVSHAYLFSGPRGTGKTTTAKLLAKAVNCPSYNGHDACGVCESCQTIASNQSQDIIEIDAASNNGVDEIRDLRDKVKYAPASAKFKVYIIDEVHMLTTGAFNALLKTLEEPPAHVIFVLATTEPHKIPLTIISRCQRFDFKKLSRESIVGRLTQICEAEDIVVADNVLKLIAKISDGGMRDAIGILDQCVAFADEIVKLDDVYELTGVVSINMLESIVYSTIYDQKVECLKLINDFNELGKDVVRLAEDIVLYLRDMILFKHIPNLDDVSGNIYVSDRLSELSGLVDEQVIYQAIDKLSKAINDMRYSSNPKIVLEMAMLSLIEFDRELVKMKPITKTKEVVVPKPAEIIKLETEETPVQTIEESVVETFVDSVSKVDEPSTPKEDEPTNTSFDSFEPKVVVAPQVIVEESNKETLVDKELSVKDFNIEPSLELDNQSPAIEELLIENLKKEEEQEPQEIDAERVRELIRQSDELKARIREIRINNVLALAHKPELEMFKSRWQSIKAYSTDPVFGPIANLIGSSTLTVASAEGILVTFEHLPMAERVMDKIDLVEKLVEIIYNRSVYVVAVTNREWVSIKDEYILKSRRGHKYVVIPQPSMEEVYKIDHEIKTSKVKEEPIIQKALDLDFIDEDILTIED